MANLTRRDFLKTTAAGVAAANLPLLWARGLGAASATRPIRPNIVLVMTDDQGWGDTGYNSGGKVKTPNLDAMAAAGLRFDRFYAAAPVCSPTRASVLTGRHPNRCRCFTYGKPMPLAERTLAEVLRAAGYATGHFGKWHLNGRSGPGKPISAKDPLHPGRSGFDEWFSVSNYFDLNTAFGRHDGTTVETRGDGSDVIVAEAQKFIARAAEKKQPFLAVVWYGSPHNPHKALPADRKTFGNDYYGEIGAVDRSVGALRAHLRRLGIADDTIVWFCSDNGGARGPRSTGGLRGQKGSLWEGGVRVPGLIAWPRRIARPAVTAVPACTTDIFPTIVDLLGLTVADPVLPLDGVSLTPLLAGKMPRRTKPIPFWVYRSGKRGPGHMALIDDRWKLHLHPVMGRRPTASAPAVLLYDLLKDPKETTDLAAREPKRVAAMAAALRRWEASVRASLAGKDYPKKA